MFTSIKAKITMAVVVVVILCVASIASYFVNKEIKNEQSKLREETASGLVGIDMMLATAQEQALAQVINLSKNPLLAEAVERWDPYTVRTLSEPLMKDGKLDYMCFTNPQGLTLYRTHEPGKIPKKDDFIINQINIKKAVSGQAFVGVEEGKVVKFSVRAGAPLYKDGKLVGAITSGYVFSKNEIMETAKKQFGTDFMLFLGKELVATSIPGDVEETGKSIIISDKVEQTVLQEGQPYYDRLTIGGEEYFVGFTPIAGASGTIVGMAASAAMTAPYKKAQAENIKFIILVSIVLILLGGFAAYTITYRLLRPLGSLKTNVEQVAAGQLYHKLEFTTNDEVGELGRAFTIMTDNLRALVTQVTVAVDKMAECSQQFLTSSEQSAQTASQVAASITEVTRGTQQQVEQVVATTSIIEQMSVAIQQVAANAQDVTKVSAKTAETAKDGDLAVEKVVGQMRSIEAAVTNSAEVVTKLGERSQEIGQIVDVIATIAGQTNLLALNAAIEAARAGEQGRGFAVVADEVRKLAEQSQDAAKQIAELITEIQADTGKAVTAMNSGTQEVKLGTEVVNEAGQAFSQIVRLTDDVSGQVSEIGAATQQMACSSQEVVANVRSIEHITRSASGQSQEVAAATEEQAAFAEEIASSCNTLIKLAEQLRNEIGKFKL